MPGDAVTFYGRQAIESEFLFRHIEKTLAASTEQPELAATRPSGSTDDDTARTMT
jgi:hypothetical protein